MGNFDSKITGSRPYTGALPGRQAQAPQAPESVQGAATGSQPVSTPPETGILGGIKSFFNKIASTLEAAFEPVDQRVKSAQFRAGGASPVAPAQAAAAVGGVGELPNTQVSYNDLAKYARANQNIDYFELERGNVNKGLSTYLNQFKQQLDANPQLREQLSKTQAGQEFLAALDRVAQGQVGTDDVIALQKFIVASGVDIGYEGNAEGIDGQYGAKTHAGLQQAFAKLLQDPAGTVASLDTGLARANQGVESLRRAQDGEIDRYVPGQSAALPDTDPANPTGPAPVATDLGRRIWESAQQTARQMGNNGYCMKGVRTTLDRIGIPLRDANGNNLPSAYMAADVIATQHRDKFTEMKPVSRADLRNLPPGAVVVWDRNPDPALRRANPSNGYSHGHIEVIGPGGQAISDGLQRWGVTMNNNGRYGGFRVFLPNS